MTAELEFHDPVTRVVESLADVLGNRIDILISFEPSEYEAHRDAVDWLDNFCHQIHWRVKTPKLEYVVSNFAEALSLIRLTKEHLAAPMNTPRQSETEYDQNIEHELEKLLPQVKAVGPLQLAVQRHFTTLIGGKLKMVLINWSLTRRPMTPESLLMFLPLASLRDQLFRSPKVEFVEEYLAFAERVATSSRYHREFGLVSKSDREDHQGILDELAVEIEALSMVEASYSEVSVTTSSVTEAS